MNRSLLDIEDMLTSAGYVDITVLATCVDGIAFLDTETPALAIFDIHFKDGPCTELAHILASRNVPFIVVTGSHMKDADEVFRQRPWIAEPWARRISKRGSRGSG